MTSEASTKPLKHHSHVNKYFPEGSPESHELRVSELLNHGRHDPAQEDLLLFASPYMLLARHDGRNWEGSSQCR